MKKLTHKEITQFSEEQSGFTPSSLDAESAFRTTINYSSFMLVYFLEFSNPWIHGINHILSLCDINKINNFKYSTEYNYIMYIVNST